MNILEENSIIYHSKKEHSLSPTMININNKYVGINQIIDHVFANLGDI